MAKTITQLPPATTVTATTVLPADNAAATATEKVTVAQIVALAPVQAVAGRTGNVALTVADVSGAVASTDSRLTDQRVPTSHASTHQTGGADAISPVILTPAALSASQNDYAPGVCDILRLSSSAALDITGLASPSIDGAMRLLINTNASGGASITLRHESSSSAAANRFRNTTGGDFILPADGGSAVLAYSSAISRWRIL